MPKTIDATLQRIEEAHRLAEAVEVRPKGTALDFLRAVYRNADVPLPARMKAASIAIEYEHPRLAVTAMVDGKDFAAALDRAIERSGKARAPKLIEHRASPTIEHGRTPVTTA
jgi:hypothetical protein